MGNDQYAVTRTATSDKEVAFDIEIEPRGFSIKVKAYKDLVSIRFSGAGEKYFSDVRGLMGDFNGVRFSRTGKEIMSDDNAFGQEWQVRPGVDPELFQTKPVAEWPAQTCVLPDATSKQRRRRLGEGIPVEAAEKACAQFVHQDDHDACIYDILATGDLGAAQSGAF